METLLELSHDPQDPGNGGLYLSPYALYASDVRIGVAVRLRR
jgi:hypothetical protein